MQSMRDIKRQITSVENTKKITKAMKMVAAAKLQKAQQRAEDAKPFFEQTKHTLAKASSKIDNNLHPLLAKRDKIEKIGYIVITGDRGLCGPYNSRIIKQTEELIAENNAESALVTIGKNGRNYFSRADFEIISEYIELADKPGMNIAVTISQEVSELFLDGVLDRVYLVYTDFETILNHNVEVETLLPIEPSEIKDEQVEKTSGSYIYDPSEGAVLSSVLPQYLRNVIFGALLQAKASEFAARMTAMDSATENAEEMIAELTLSYNRARQAAITQEISEIVGGAEALQ